MSEDDNSLGFRVSGPNAMENLQLALDGFDLSDGTLNGRPIESIELEITLAPAEGQTGSQPARRESDQEAQPPDRLSEPHGPAEQLRAGTNQHQIADALYDLAQEEDRYYSPDEVAERAGDDADRASTVLGRLCRVKRLARRKPSQGNTDAHYVYASTPALEGEIARLGRFDGGDGGED